MPWKIFQERADLILKAVIDLVLGAADTEHVGREPGAAVVFEDLQNFFALAKRIKEDGHSADVEGVRSEPEQVAGNAVQFRHNDADVLSPWRSGYAEQLFDSLAKSEAVRNCGDVIHPVQRRHELAVCLRLAQFLDPAMKISDDALRVDDTLAVQPQFHLEHAVRRR